MTFSRISRWVSRSLHLEVALEQIDDRQVAGRLAVGHGARLQDEPVLGPVGVGELVEQPRLAHPGLADDRHQLTAPGAGLLEGPAELLDLGVAADEARQAAGRGRLEARSRRRRPRPLVDLDRLAKPFHRDGAQRLHLDVALGEPQGVGRQADRAGVGQLLHPRGQVRRLADRRVVHVQIAADRADDDLAGVQADADLHVDAVRCAGRSSAYRFTDSCMRSAA